MDIGAQSIVFGDAELEAIVESLERIGVEHVEFWRGHFSPTSSAAERQFVADADVTLRGYGTVDVDDTGQAREHVAFADEVGADYVTVNYPPARDDITAELAELGAEYGVDIAIHNTSTVHNDDLSGVFSSLDDVRGVLDEHDYPRLGACIDTGHFLVMGESPERALSALGERTVAVHLKDTSDAEIEDVPGAETGALDLSRVAALVEEHAAPSCPAMIEYELDGSEETLRRAVENTRSAFLN